MHEKIGQNKIAVLIATYNGEKYIEAQLESIKKQSLLPDLVLIADDCSSDKTVHIIEEYIKNNTLLNWKLVKNENNKGYKNNFIDNLVTLKGYNVFLCDQDDVWEQDKIQIMVKTCKSNEDILLLASGYTVVDENLQTKREVLNYKGKLEQITLETLINRSIYPGMSFLVTSELLDMLFPLKYDIWIHDLYIASIAALNNGFYVLEHSLVKYRQHSNNQIGGNTIQIDYKSREKNLTNKIKNDELFINCTQSVNDEEIKKLLLQKYNFDKVRHDIFVQSKLIKLIQNFRNYIRFYSIINFLADFYYCIRFYRRGKK